MSSHDAGELPRVAVEFRSPVWEEEVERLDPRANARVQAERARKEIEAGRRDLDWRRCESAGEDGTNLPACRKLYVPLYAEGATAAPFGFVFRLTKSPDETLAWVMIAFGERHPSNDQTRSVYERAHKRLHSRYP